MADALKDHFGPDVPGRIARSIVAKGHPLAEELFMREVLDGYDELGLMQRGRHIAKALRRHLPQDYPTAIRILLDSLDGLASTQPAVYHGMSSFVYLPHTFFVADYGLNDFELSMQAQHRLTQLFTAEFSIRPFLQRWPERTLSRLREWTKDPSPHVRRLVSEGTRPRLPWAPRLRAFQADPRPVLDLLDFLKDDPELYVRRSVANNLNDIGKDHPELLIRTARAWMKDAGPERSWLVRHALRSAVKRGEPGALEIIGFGEAAEVAIYNGCATPREVPIGSSVKIAFELENPGVRSRNVLVDARVHFVKARGETRPKVFKIGAVELAPGARAAMSKTISLAVLTTRRPYPGLHAVDLLLNGKAKPLCEFQVLPA